MNVTTLVHCLDSRDELVSQQKHRLEGKLAATIDKHVLKTGPEKLNHHNMVFSLSSIPQVLWEAMFTPKLLQKLCFFNNLWASNFELLKLYCDFFASLDVFAEENLAERPGANHAAHLEPVVHSDFIRVVSILSTALGTWWV